MDRYNKTERIGVAAIEQVTVRDLGWIFREQPIDVGIDAHVELVLEQPTGKLIALQIKTGRSHFLERIDDFVYYIDSVHLKYWLSYSLSVILVAYLPDSNEAFWVPIRRDTVQRSEADGWKISIPKGNIFGSATRRRLSALFECRQKVTWADDVSPIRFPAIIRRSELHRHFGGPRQTSISPSSRSLDVLLFCLHTTWETPGLAEGWRDDGCFHYLGTEQTTTRRLIGRNRALLDRVEKVGWSHVFKGLDGPVEYQGRFELDSTQPYYWSPFGRLRGTPFFRLRPIDQSPRSSRGDEASLRRLALLTGYS